MQRNIYVLFDNVSGNFGELFTLANDAEMRREFEQLIRNPAVPDYAIRDCCVVRLGSFVSDAENPHIVPESIPSVILRGGNYNVSEIRGQVSSVSAPASELHPAEDCEAS